jgi:CHAD domain-containing protein
MQIKSVDNQPETMRVWIEGSVKDSRGLGRKAKLWTILFGQTVQVRAVPPRMDLLGMENLKILLAMQSPGVEAADTLAEAGRKVMGFQFAEMLRHEEGTRLGEDIEELHDMRVATRRMRAAFEVFADGFKLKSIGPHLKGLRATGRALGRVRDLDVFMEKAQHYLDTLPEDHRSGLDPLLDGWREEREKDRGEMMDHLNDTGYADFKRKFLSFLTTPGEGGKKVDPTSPHLVHDILPVLVYTRLGAVRAFASILDSATIEQLHALRIEFKKLRYTLEFFQEVLGGEAKALIEELKILQDHLGDLNDADVACGILRDFLDEWENRQLMVPIDERENPEPIVAYLATRHAERHRLIVTFREAWARFDRPEIRVKFAKAVSVL